MSEYSGVDDWSALREAYKKDDKEKFKSGCGGNKATLPIPNKRKKEVKK